MPAAKYTTFIFLNYTLAEQKHTGIETIQWHYESRDRRFQEVAGVLSGD